MLYRVSLAVFLVVFGLVLLFSLERGWEIVAGIAAVIAGVFIALELNNSSTRA